MLVDNKGGRYYTSNPKSQTLKNGSSEVLEYGTITNIIGQIEKKPDYIGKQINEKLGIDRHYFIPEATLYPSHLVIEHNNDNDIYTDHE